MRVTPVPGGPRVVPRAGYLVVDDLGDLMGTGFPGSSRCGRVSVSAVDLIPGLDVFLPGSMFPVVV